jgi:hypothetical protein
MSAHEWQGILHRCVIPQKSASFKLGTHAPLIVALVTLLAYQLNCMSLHKERSWLCLPGVSIPYIDSFPHLVFFQVSGEPGVSIDAE